MRRLVLAALLVLTIAPSTALSDTVPQLFNAGVSEYRQGNFERAAGIFLDLYEKYEVKSPDVLVNLGAAEFASGKSGQALAHLARAVRTSPGSRAAQTAEVNMDRIRSLLNERQNDMSRSAYVFGSYTDPWIALFSWVPARPALIVFLACWAVFFVALAIRRHLPRKVSMVLAGATLGLMLISALGAYASSRIAGYRTGVVIRDQAPLMAGIASTQASAGLPEGLEFRVLDVRGSWIEIRLSSGLSGWIADSDAVIP